MIFLTNIFLYIILPLFKGKEACFCNKLILNQYTVKGLSPINNKIQEIKASGSSQGIRNYIVFPFNVPDVKIIFL